MRSYYKTGLGIAVAFFCIPMINTLQAEPFTLDFDAALHQGSDFAAVADSPIWNEQGFTVSLLGQGDLGSWGTGSSSFLDSPALGPSASSTQVVLTQQNGQPFSLQSIDVLDYLSNQAGGNVGQSVTFYGLKPNDTWVQSTFNFSTADYDRERHTFNNDFAELLSVQWNENGANQPVAQAPANRVHMFDNIVVTPSTAPKPAGLTIVALGDSTTAPRVVGAAQAGRPQGVSSFGRNEADPANPPYNIAEPVDATSPQLYVYSDILRDELGDHGVVLHSVNNEGIGSNRTDQAVARLAVDVTAKRPDVVIVQYGINDSWTDDAVPTDPENGNDGLSRIAVDDYADNLRSIVGTLTAAEARVVLMSPNMQAEPYDEWRNTRLYQYVLAMESVYAEALESGKSVDYIDVWQMNQDYVAAGGNLGDLLLDGQHPNALGHRMEADALLRLLAVPEPGSMSCLAVGILALLRGQRKAIE